MEFAAAGAGVARSTVLPKGGTAGFVGALGVEEDCEYKTDSAAIEKMLSLAVLLVVVGGVAATTGGGTAEVFSSPS